MDKATVNLEEAEVNNRLCSYESQEVTGELYDFGKLLVSEMVSVNHYLDAKGATLAGYSTGAVVLLVSTSSFWRPLMDQWASAAVFAAAICAVLASAFSLKAASLFTFKWFSDNEWLYKKYLGDLDTLRRYRILSMHGIVESHRQAAADKSWYLRFAQWALGTTGLLLLVAFIDITWKA